MRSGSREERTSALVIRGRAISRIPNAGQLDAGCLRLPGAARAVEGYGWGRAVASAGGAQARA